jgi:hypothetical protein
MEQIDARHDPPRPGLLAARQGLPPGHYESVGRGQERARPKTPADPLPIDKLHFLLRRSVVGYFIGHDTYGLLTGPGSVEGSMASWPGLPHGH